MKTGITTAKIEAWLKSKSDANRPDLSKSDARFYQLGWLEQSFIRLLDHPEEVAKLRKEIEASFIEIVVNHPQGPDGFETLAEAEAFAEELEEKGIEAEVCFFKNGATCDRTGNLL